MKVFVFILFSIFSGNLLAQSQPEFTYVVETGGTTYDFILTFVKDDSTGIGFKYRMTNSAKTSGNVVMTAAAIDTATAITNYFSGGSVILTDRTAVFLSQAMMKALARKNTVIMRIDNGEQVALTGKKENPEPQYKVMVNDKETVMEVYDLVDAIKSEEYFRGAHFKVSKTNGMIVYMNLGFKVWLKSVKM